MHTVSGSISLPSRGKTLNLKGGATDVSNEDNIGVVKGNDNTLNVRLAKNLKGIESIDGLKEIP
ncbi:hypothetical protein [Taylorella asinigenitalis]|uniref:hypothetical protein n=1 Tax=Taylorella asinigenitalis TaxID=84590 RepID=UPI000ABC452E|nr:hypothetical protein [Taylorella asinigenitalis]